MATKNEITIPVFDGEDYSMWKKRITLFLKYKKCNNVINRVKTAADKDDWEDKDLMAMNYIYSAISNKQLEFVSGEDTAYKIMKKFDEMYLRESTALQIVCRNKLEKMRLDKYSDTASFFIEFEKSVNELKCAGAQVSEKEKLNYMLNTLPSSYSYVGDLIDALKEEDQTVAYVKNKIHIAEMKDEKNEHGERRTNAYGAKREGCFKCGKPGHYARNCKDGGQAGSNTDFGRGTTRGRERGRTGRSYYGSWRGNFRSQPVLGTHHEKKHEQSRSGTSAWVATVHMTYNSEVNKLSNCEINWLLDSGCTDHIINNEKYFDKCIILKEPVNIYLGDNRPIKATKIGNVVSYFNAFGKRNEVIMKNVYYAKDMNSNLISFGKLTNNNTIISKGNVAKVIDKNNKCIAVAFKDNGTYNLRSVLKNKENFVNSAELNNNMSQKERWHRMLGHVNFNYLNVLSKQQLLTGIPNELETEFMKCKTCVENKMHNLPFNNNRTKAKTIMEIIHTDVCGPFNTIGLKGEKYFVSFIDDYSKIAKVYCIRSKDEVFDNFVQFVNEAENLTENKLKILRCDNGKEYLNSRFYEFAKNKGIVINNCPAYVHELNGTAERFNRTIMDMGRCLLAEAKVHKRFWPEIICAATYLKNRTLANTVEKKTPYEIFFKKKPNVENLRLYGSRVFVRKPEQNRVSKWEKKADMGILLGYSDVGYRVLVNNKIIVTRNVDIVEEIVKIIGINDNTSEDENNDDTLSNKEFDITKENDQNEIIENVNDINTEKLEILRKSKREKRSPIRYPENDIMNNVRVNYCRIDTPCTFKEAINSKESKNWEMAMDKEIENLNENNTWKLVERVDGKEVLEVKWVYTRKSDDTYKARLVVRGFQQTDVLDDIYSPVAKNQTLKVLLSFCCQFGFIIEQMDVVTAFLNGKVSSEVYVIQPQGYEDGTNRVCRLNKALYGLRESPRDWYECLDEYLTNLGFIKGNVDFCLYSHGKAKEVAYVLIYVDDLLICSKSKRKIENIKKLLSEKFKMKDLGEIKEFLGIKVVYDYCKNEMVMSQTEYIESLVHKYQVQNSRLYSTPMETNLKLEKAEECEMNMKYRNLIGALLYISSSTRPDVSHSVNYLSRFQNCYNDTHWKYAMRILKYLYLTKDLKLHFKRNERCDILDCYVDADWAGDRIDRKSTSGFVIRLFGNVIYWKSRKQKCVTKASTFAEYVALSAAVSELKFIKELVKMFNISLTKSIKIYEDNSGVINIAKYGNFTKNSKHIEIHYHYVHECVKDKIIEVVKVSSENNMADILTKSLCKFKFEKFRELMNVK